MLIERVDGVYGVFEKDEWEQSQTSVCVYDSHDNANITESEIEDTL